MLKQLTVSNLTYTYEDSPTPALEPVSATFPLGWTGVVGDNGSGKTTLLRIITGKLEGYGGSIMPETTGVYCAQPTEYLPEKAEEFALDYDSETIHLRSMLGVDEEWVWRFDTLSHGERKRLQIAVALWQRPAVLALDEPTNHVDAATREQLLTALKAFEGVGLLVSHDRGLLDALVGQCLFLENGTATMRPGSYSGAREQGELERQSTLNERKNAKAKLQHLHEEKARRAEQANRADAKKSKKGISAKDHSAKAKIDLARVSGQDGQAGRLSSQMDSKLKAAEERVAAAHISKRYDGDIWVDAQPARRKVLTKLPEGTISMGERTLHHGDLYIGNTDRIGLWGQNGAGKSTLIRRLVATLPEDEQDRVLYIPQELTGDEGRAILEQVRLLSHEEQGRVLSAVAQLNSSPKRILAGDDLSPGELRKVMLAMGIVNEPYLIIMDEPTNHLDIHSIEALEQVLSGCPCALVLVSHDAHFLEALTTTRWEFTVGDNGAKNIEGNHGRDTYVTLKQV